MEPPSFLRETGFYAGMRDAFFSADSLALSESKSESPIDFGAMETTIRQVIADSGSDSDSGCRHVANVLCVLCRDYASPRELFVMLSEAVSQPVCRSLLAAYASRLD